MVGEIYKENALYLSIEKPLSMEILYMIFRPHSIRCDNKYHGTSLFAGDSEWHLWHLHQASQFAESNGTNKF